MAQSRNAARAVILMPPGVVAEHATPVLRRWLAKGHGRSAAASEEPLTRLLPALGRPPLRDGLGALRWWGQTGRRPDGWLCAADPIYLEPRLDHLCLFALNDVADADFAALIAEIDARLAPDRDLAFSCIGTHGYLASDEPLGTATVSSWTVHGERPEKYLPVGPAAVAHDRLQAELQMCLHDLDLNRRREENGRPPINALWFWGGGAASAGRAIPLPPLFSDDSLIGGYWLSVEAEPSTWPGGFAECVRAAGAAFVAAPPPRPDGNVYLEELRALTSRGELEGLVLLFCDGLRVDLERRHRLRFWRVGLPGRGDT